MNLDAAIADLAKCRYPRDYFRVHKTLELHATPLELAELHARKRDLPLFSRFWLGKLLALGGFKHGPVQPYSVTELVPGIELYSNPDFDRAAKRLIVGFCGSSQRLMLPVATVLQNLPSSQFDILLMKDATRNHFADGIPAVGSGFPGLTAWIRTEGKVKDYARLYCYGTSMGGFAALRYGLMLDADRAIAVGGRFVSHVRRLTEPDARPIKAFEPLCACARSPRGEMVCVFGADHANDRRHVETLARSLPVRVVELSGIASHNVMHKLARRRRLGQFFAELFDFA